MSDFEAVMPTDLQGNASQAMLMAEMQRMSQTSRGGTIAKLEQQFRIDQDMARDQLRSMLMYTERALSNEASNRMLGSMFGKFGLIQKIAQNMG
ncbi:MAG: hypothetical protein ACRC14_13475 [Paracoccaceae bacterium]